MILNRLYTNKKELFPDIVFNRGLNVIIAKVKRSKDSTKDSHNLGKTLLIDVLEFVLLKGVTEGLFLTKRLTFFRDFIFFIDLELYSGEYLTVKRTVSEPSGISFKKHLHKDELYLDLPDEEWDHNQMAFQKAREMLSTYLELTSIKNWSFRKGVSYFLRKQQDYQDTFQISKYIQGEHKDWKPYVACILGFNDTLLSDKYELDDAIEGLGKEKQEAQKELIFREDEYDRVRGMFEIKRQELGKQSEALDSFDFHEREVELTDKLVEKTEVRISYLNNEIYNIKYDIEKINQSLKAKLSFNLNEVKQIFEETKVNFPAELKKGYKDLLGFTRKITRERNDQLRERLKELESILRRFLEEHESLGKKRQSMLEVLKGQEPLRKFKDLQKSLDADRADLKVMETQLQRLSAAIQLTKQINALNDRRRKVRESIAAMVHDTAEIYSKVRTTFNLIIQQVLNRRALLSIKITKAGDLDFRAEFMENTATEEATSEAEGTTYKKLLCVAFDLAVLRIYKNQPFFRFVYHDGVFEVLDNRKKLRLLDVIRESCNSYGIQYILSIIEDDLPRDAKENKILFKPEEIIRELHEEGDSGRLFRMKTF